MDGEGHGGRSGGNCLSRRDLLKVAAWGVGAAGARVVGAGVAAVSVIRAGVRGADLSFVPQLEAAGAVYRHASGAVLDPLVLVRSRGVNLVRLRLWHTPAGGWCGLARTVAMAQRARVLGMGVLLDVHYSDTWADPGVQTPPAAWAGLSGAGLRSAVRAYTRDVLVAMAGAGVWPAMVQLGNEVTDGMLWPHGRVSGAGWGAFAAVYGAARDGVDDAAVSAGRVRPGVVLHTDRGGDNAGARWFYDNAVAQGMRFDTVGLSYYPWWHGGLAACVANVEDLRWRYGREVMVVETAYPWTLGWNDNEHNVVGLVTQLLPGYAATPGGQLAFLSSLDVGLVGAGAAGWCYWAPEWVAAPGVGSAWENLAWFGFDGRLL
ncbi:MAG: glycosyl hydrolase 53 family protein [Phycisphaerales bacterium]